MPEKKKRPSLRVRVQNLPAELRNEIQGLVLHVNVGTVDIGEDWKPPVELQITKAARVANGKRYYEESIFILHEKEEHDLAHFLCAVPSQYRNCVKDVRMRMSTYPVAVHQLSKHASEMLVEFDTSSKRLWRIVDDTRAVLGFENISEQSFHKMELKAGFIVKSHDTAGSKLQWFSDTDLVTICMCFQTSLR